MKLLLENWRGYLNESSDAWVKTIWVSNSAYSELNQVLEDSYEDSQHYLRSCKRDLHSCDANTNFWLKTLMNAGFKVEAVRDGVYNDAGEMIGHDWIIIKNDGIEIIVDAAAEQFDTEPHKDKYIEGGYREQGAEDETPT